MSDKNIDEKVDKMEEAVEQYASANTVISIGGYSFTPAKLMIAGTIVSTILGGLYGAFEIYKDYMDMRQKITEYVAPDLSEFKEKLAVLEKDMGATKSSVQEGTNYANEIKNDLKRDIRRLEGNFENLERNNKQSIRDTEKTVNEVKKDVDSTLKEVRRYSDQTVKEINKEVSTLQKETDRELKSIKREIDAKIKQALDNPLANGGDK